MAVSKPEFVEFSVGNNYTVDITLINDPHSFYVRSYHAGDILSEIEKPGKPMAAQDLEPGIRVVYKSKKLKRHVRGQLFYTSIDKQSCDLFAIDYGHFEKDISLDCIFSPGAENEHQNSYPPMGIHCRLYYCEPIGEKFSEEVIKTMKSIVGRDYGIITVKNKMSCSKLVVELWSRANWCDVGHMLNMMDLTYLTNSSFAIHRSYVSAVPFQSTYALTQTLKFKHRNIKVGDLISVRVQSGKSFSEFYVAEQHDYKKMMSGMVNFNEYCKMQPELEINNINPGVCCAVRVGCPPKYERAIIKETCLETTRAVVKLVDCGKEIEAHHSWIKPIRNEKWFSRPVVAIYCSAVAIPSPLPSVLQFVLPPGYEFTIQVVEVGHEFERPHKVKIFFPEESDE